MKRIQILIPDCLKNPMGGMGEQARQIIKVFPKQYYFDIIGSAKSEDYTDKNYSFYPISDLRNMAGKPDPLASIFLSQSLYIEKAMSLKKPDIIHAFDWSTFWAGRLLAKHYDVPLIVTIQLSIEKSISKPHPLQAGNHQMACSLETSGMIDANRIIQVSKNYAESFNRIFLPKTRVIENGINLSEWTQKNNITLPGNGKHKIVYIGRFAEMKNVLSLLKAEILEDVDLIFIGGNRGGTSEIQDAIIRASKERDNIHYLGAKYGQKKVDLLMAADGMIVPSVHEPFGIVALEALASRSILLSSFVGGMDDFLNEETAINCGTSPESISNAIKRFSSMSDVEKSNRIENGLEICRNYSWKKQAQKLKNVYDEVFMETTNKQGSKLRKDKCKHYF